MLGYVPGGGGVEGEGLVMEVGGGRLVMEEGGTRVGDGGGTRGW